MILMNDFDEKFDRAFSVVSFAANRHIVDHMRRLRVQLDLDIETAYIWGILAQLNLAHLLHPDSAPSCNWQRNVGYPEALFNPVRLADVTQVSGLPRETVRRKLESLKSMGKVEQNEAGLWQMKKSGVDEATYNFTKETVIRLLQTAKSIESVLNKI